MRPQRLKQADINSLRDLSEERWRNHNREHVELAANLKEYKETSNAWRASLLDLRATFLPRAEYEAEHRATKADFGADVKALGVQNSAASTALEARLVLLEDFVKTSKVRDETNRSFFSNGRNLTLFMVAVLSALLAAITFLDGRLSPN